MTKIKNIFMTITFLLLAQFILIYFHLQFSFQDVWDYIGDYWFHYLFNVILLYVIFLAFLVLINRKVFAWYLFFITILLFSIANYLKISYRSEPLLPSDFSMIFELNQIIQLINGVHLIMILVFFIIFIVSIFFLVKLKTHRVFTLKYRIILSLVIFFIFSSFFFSHHSNNPFRIVANMFGISDMFWDLGENYSQNGPLVGFIEHLDIEVMEEEPVDYSYEVMSEIVQKYKDKVSDMNEGRDSLDDHTVVFILSESFVDPLRIPSLELSDDPIPFIRSLLNETTSGILLGSNYGGGTSNVEYEVLTGFTTNYFHRSLAIPYTLLVPNLNNAPNITNRFTNKKAVHTFNASLYRRTEVFEKFGFDQFIYDGGELNLSHFEKMDNGAYISDQAAYQEVLDIIQSDEENGFILLTTMQNHGPYEKDQYNNQFEVLNDLDDTQTFRIETYVQGLKYTDIATENFINEINEIDKPITVVFFGDHLPSEVFEVFDESNGSDEVFYETDYFIYSNFETDVLDYPMVSPNVLSAILLEQLNVELSPYYVLLNEIKNLVPVIRWGEYLLQPDQTFLYEDELPEDIQELVDDYRLLQYDINAGEQYAIELGMFESVE